MQMKDPKIKLIHVSAKLLAMGIDLETGAGVDALQVELHIASPINSWSYNFAEDTLLIDAPAETSIDSFLQFGEVVPDDSILQRHR